MKINEKPFLPQYSVYVYEKKELAITLLLGVILAACIAWIFYRNIAITIIFSIVGLLYPSIKRKELLEKKRNILRLQFKDMLYYLGSSLSAGKSVEMSFNDVYKSLLSLYPDNNFDIIKELDIIMKKLKMNESIEDIFNDFSLRTQIEEIKYFSDVFSACKRSGGNLVEVIRTTSRLIGEKIEIKQEIDSLLLSKKQEQKLLIIAPFGMILFISQIAGDFIEPMFNTPAGFFVMTISLILIVAGSYVASRIMNIKI